MTHNQKVYIFVAVLVVTMVWLWGIKGVTKLLPGPDAK